jgi:hypothetical protein
MGFGKRSTNETLGAAAVGMVHNDSSRSFHDIFATQNAEHAKDIIMSSVRHEIHRSQSRATSESGSDEYIMNKIDPVDQTATPTIVHGDKSKRKPTMLLAGPKFRLHTVEPEVHLKRDTIYPIAVKDFGFFCVSSNSIFCF